MGTNRPCLSVIIPVYNTGHYLSRCLDSVLGQSFQDFELLLIDDGSTDGSGTICDAYAAKDCRIRVFHKKNGGVSSARNLGLDNAKGEWVYFADSDDELMTDGLQTLVNCITDDVDVVMAGYEEIDEDGNVIVESEPEYKTSVLSKKESVMACYHGYGKFYYYSGYIWLRMFKSRVINDFNLRFADDIAIKEDTLFVVQYLCKSSGKTNMTSKPIYKYYRRSDSAMGKTTHGFDYNYVDSFYAFVRMKHEIELVFPWYSEAVFVAKKGVFGRCYAIMGKMQEYGVKDEVMKKKLFSMMKEEVGSIALYKMRRKIRKILKKNH